MAGQNDFLIFDENKDNMLTQELYSIDGDRTDGFKKGLARSNVNNKVLHQTSKMCSAIGELIKGYDGTATDGGTLTELVDNINGLFIFKPYVKSANFKKGVYVVGTVNENIYFAKSLIDNNTGHDLTDKQYWEEVKLGGGSGLEICDIGMALYVDETKGLRRYLNGQIVDINTNTQAFLNRLKEITTLHPSLLCTEQEWQTAKTMSAFGQVGKFVFNYNGDEVVSVRIPRVVNIQGLFDLQNLGMTVEAGLPNHDHITHGKGIITGGGIKGYLSNLNRYFSGGGDASFGVTSSTPNTNFRTGDASENNPIYGNSDTVQPEAIQYPYFIQIATGSETENNIVNDIELNNPYSLFDFKWTDHEQNNLSWTRGDTFDWKPSATYPSAYNELLSEYNNSESVEETEGDVTFKRTPKGYKIALADQETAIASKYETYGIAWYYLLDTANTQFKLPRTQYGFKGIKDNVGDYIAESLPNITASVDTPFKIFNTGVGAFTPYSKNYHNFAEAQSAGTYSSLAFNASRSSSTYQDGAPVQERATQMYLYFYVGETVQNANLIDAGRIGEQVANCITRSDCKAYITETYVNGTSGYNIYSNKYCEQWGVSPSGEDKATVTVTLLKAFKDTNYNVISVQRNGPSGDYTNGIRVINYGTGSFQLNYRTGGATTAYWRACGYIA